MSAMCTVVATYLTHLDAETAVKQLQIADFEMMKISIIGKDHHTEENFIGYYDAGDRTKAWGRQGAFWGGLGLLHGSAFFPVPDIGPLVVAGPLVHMIVSVFEGAVVLGGLSAFGAALYNIGVPKDSVLHYETALRADTFLVIAHGLVNEVGHARDILDKTTSTHVRRYSDGEKEVVNLSKVS